MSPSDEEQREGADSRPEAIRRAVDELDTGSPSPDHTPTRPTQALELPDEVRQRIQAALGEVAYLQHAYATEHHHVCHVGLRAGETIRQQLVVAGPDGVATLPAIQERVDELRAGADASEIAGATIGTEAGTR